MEQEDVRHVTERYIARSFPFIVIVSTSNATSNATSKAPGGLLERIGKDSERECLYKRLKMDYNYELDKIYAKQKNTEGKSYL